MPACCYAGLVGAFLTSLYTFRLIFIVFHGEAKTEAHAGRGLAHGLPLVVLIVLSTFVGALIHRRWPACCRRASGMPAAKPSTVWKSPPAPLPWPVSCSPPLLFLGKRSLVAAIAQSAPGAPAQRLVAGRLGIRLALRQAVRAALPADLPPARRATRSMRSIGLVPRLARASHGTLSRSADRPVCAGMPPSIVGGAVLLLGVVLL